MNAGVFITGKFFKKFVSCWPDNGYKERFFFFLIAKLPNCVVYTHKCTTQSANCHIMSGRCLVNKIK